ncbi:MAG: hypothetical protein AMXMBFR56_47730 [Polyangiaceae bacterium]
MESDESERSVYDFLYVDHPRLASYLAQLPDAKHGNVEKVSHELATEERGSKKAEANAGVFKGGYEAADGTSSKLSVTYNPQWVLARNFLDAVETLGLIRRGLPGARLGEIVLLEGSLGMQDFRLMQPLWESLLDAFAGDLGFDLNPGRAKKTSQVAQQQQAFKRFVGAFMKGMPHSVSMHLRNDDGAAWCAVEPELMTVRPEAITLGRGASLPGTWFILGIVDATDEVHEEATQEGMAEAVRAAIAALRGQFGRPADSHAVTPLLIFREVRPPA